MRLPAIARALAAGLCMLPAAAAAQDLAAQYRERSERIITAALADSSAYRRLAQFVDKFGHRLSGSVALERGIDWVLAEMKRDRLQNVRGEPVIVPRWVRGRESATLISPRMMRLHMLGLGNSVGTPPRGIAAPVLVVTSFDDLTRRAAQARGKIVLFDVPFTSYGAAVLYRWAGASAAARVGAVAALVRSVASFSIRSPHTGVMGYDSLVAKKIPAAALSVEDAAMIHRMQDRGERVVLRLEMEARMLPDAPSRNIVGELIGSERPEEVVVVGGHIDSWDVGQGAMDDAGGVFAAWEAVRLLQRLGLRARRTIRVVGWTNEENGLRGATAYRDAHAAALPGHKLAIESDGGVFTPRELSVNAPESAIGTLREIATLLSGVGLTSVAAGGGGADVDPLAERGVPTVGLEVDGSRYFWFHHSEGDTIDKLDPREMNQCIAVLAVLAYIVADMPGELARPTVQ